MLHAGRVQLRHRRAATPPADAARSSKMPKSSAPEFRIKDGSRLHSGERAQSLDVLIPARRRGSRSRTHAHRPSCRRLPAGRVLIRNPGAPRRVPRRGPRSAHDESEFEQAAFSGEITAEIEGIIPGLEPDKIVFAKRWRIDVFPVGIETAAFADLSRRSVQLPFVKRVIRSLNGRALIIGVDRLDYSKGIAHRLSAFELFLQTQSDWRGKVTYLQIAPKSRTEIPEYAAMEQEIGSAAGRINGAYGEADWTPIRYINRAYSHSTLAGLYRAARVGLVTPLRDGMNLVAKEYVASQNPDDPGVLILSRFAGAAQECKAALLVNPYDPDSVAAAIGQALSMPLAQRRERHDALFQVLSHNNIQHWADRFLAALEREPMALSQLEKMPPAEL